MIGLNSSTGFFFVQNQKTQFRIFNNSDAKNLEELSFCLKTQFQNREFMNIFTKNCSKKTISEIFSPKNLKFSENSVPKRQKLSFPEILET